MEKDCTADMAAQKNQQENAQLENTSTQQDSFIIGETVENGVNMVSLNHGGSPWRIGATSPNWKSLLTNVSKQPSEEELKDLQRNGLWISPANDPARLTVTCGGQGGVWLHMGRALYDTYPAARAAMDRVAALADWDVLSLMDETDLEKVSRTRWQMPYIFLLGYAQASYLESLGFKPNMYSGHSLGELVSLFLAGCFPLKNAWRLFDGRAALIDDLEQAANHETGMMAVYAPYEKIEETLRTFPELYISNYNTPTQYILSGPRQMLSEARKILRKQKNPAIILNVSMAFHHESLRVLREPSIKGLYELDIVPTHTPIISNVTAGLYPDNKPGIIEYVADLDEKSVRWVDCVNNMWNDHNIRTFLEIGPGDGISGLISDIQPNAHCIAVCKKGKEIESMRRAVAELYSLGYIAHASTYAVPADIIANAEIEEQVLQDTVIERTLPHVEAIMPILMEVTGFKRHQLAAHMDLRHDLAMRSSRFPVIIHQFEQAFNIQINFEDLMNVATIGDLADAVAKFRSSTPQAEASEDAKKQIEAMPEDMFRRSVMSFAPIQFEDISNINDDLSIFAPALIVGTSAHAREYFEFLQERVEHVSLVEDLELAREKIGQEFEPAFLFLDVTQDNLSNLPSYTALLQSFLSTRKGKMCIVHASGDSSNLGSPLFASLSAMLLTAAQEYPQVTFRAILCEPCVDSVLSFIPRVLHAKQAPICINITKNTVNSGQLVPCPFEVKKVGLSIEKEHVLVVSGGGRGIMPRALEGLALLGSTLILLGRSPKADAGVLDRLAKLGATCAYYQCDVGDTEQVHKTLADIHCAWGRVDGIIHAAGILKDVTLANLKAKDLEDVIQVKCKGLENLLQAAEPYKLSYVVCISSLAAWFGHMGQANYSAANRAMSVILEDFCKARNVAWRSLWLPPIAGDVGMGANVQELLASQQIGCIDVEELPDLFARELLTGAGNNVFWHRKLPKLPTVLPMSHMADQRTANLACIKEDMQNYAHMYPLAFQSSAYPRLSFKRNFSVYTDNCLKEQNVENPVVDFALMLEALYKGAQMSFAWLNCFGLDDLMFSKQISCPDGVTREGAVVVEACDPSSQDPYQTCNATLEVHDITDNGRKVEQMLPLAQANFLLAADMPSIMPIWQNELQGLMDNDIIKEYSLPRKNIAEQGCLGYAYAAACIKLLLKLAVPANKKYAVTTISRIRHVAIMSNDNIRMYWQLHNIKQGLNIDAQICDEQGNVLLTIQGLGLLFNEE